MYGADLVNRRYTGSYSVKLIFSDVLLVLRKLCKYNKLYVLKEGLFMNMDDSKFREWYDSASQEEKELHDRLYDFDEYFLDMLFDPESLVGGLMKCQEKLDDGKWPDSFVERPPQLQFFSYNFITTKVEPLKGIGGYYNEKEQILCIAESDIKNDNVILHEMIHMYETVLNEQPLFYHDTLLWALYNDLKEKIENLDEMVSGHAHILVEQSIYSQGGLHDILFLLKSLNLDLKMGYPLGTVFGYDLRKILGNEK